MPVFQPRAERLNLSFPVTFFGDGDTLPGSCLNISLSGLFARFTRPPELWVTGRIALETGKATLTLDARIARVFDREAGVAFLFHTEAEHEAVRDLVAFAAANTQLTGDQPFQPTPTFPRERRAPHTIRST